MIIEFVGKQGSGKTSAAEKFADDNALPYIYGNVRYEIDNGLFRRSVLRTRSILHHPRLIGVGVRARLQGPSNKAVLSAVMLAARTSERLRSSGPGVYDEGPRHRIASAFMRDETINLVKWAKSLGSALPQPDVIVWVRCDPVVAQHRYELRNQKNNRRIPKLSSGLVLKQAERYDQAISHLLKGRVVEVDSTSASSEEIVIELERSLCRV